MATEFLQDLALQDRPPSWRARWVLIRFGGVLAAALSVLTGLVALLYWQDRLHEEALVKQQSHDLVNLQYELIRQELRSLESDLLVLSEQESLRRFLVAPNEERTTLEEDYVRLARVKGIYDQIRLLDTNGTEVLRVNYRQGDPQAIPLHELQGKSARYYYRQALQLSRGEVLVTPFDLNIEKGVIEEPLKPVIRLITPVDGPSGDSRRLLVLNYLGSRLLERLLESSGGARGKFLLINGDGEYLLAPQSGAAWGWMLGHHRSFAADYAATWEILQKQKDGQIATSEGLFTFRWLDPIPTSIAEKTQMREATSSSGVHRSTLIVASHVSEEELHANSRALLRRLLLVHALASLFVAGLSWYLVRAGWLRRYHERQIAESESRLRRLSSQLLAAQEDERRNISRELHDDLGQQVTAISLDIRSAMNEPEGPRRETLIREAVRETDELLRSLHRIASRVRPFVLDDLGLQDAIESHVSEYERRTGIEVLTDLAIPVRRISATMGDNVYRIIQEALANTAKHSKTKQAEVTLYAENDQLHVLVRDSGRGFDFANRDLSRLGILGIRERAELLGGRFDIETQPGKGTLVKVIIPLPVLQESHVS